MRRLSRKKTVLFAAFTVSILLIGTMTLALGVDIYLHRKFEKAAGLNIWGYRGPVVGSKQPGEIRVAVLGGSTALGYGLTWSEAFPHLLEIALNATEAGSHRRFVVVNLGFNSHGAYSFHYTLADYQYLDYDIVCLYEGYNDLGGGATLRVGRHDSTVFRMTGYYPMLPTVATEKAMQLRYGGDLRAAYRGAPVVFRPNLVDRTKAAALEASIAIVEALDQHFASTRLGDIVPSSDSANGCSPRWAIYCQSVATAVSDARQLRKLVLVVTQPYFDERHRDQQRELRMMLRARWGGDPQVSHIDLGQAVDLKDERLCWDGVHLTVAGNQKIADGLVKPVLDLVPLVGR